jgi:hypothetical protein
VGDEGVEVAEGSWDIKVETDVPGEGIFCALIRAACTDLRRTEICFHVM